MSSVARFHIVLDQFQLVAHSLPNGFGERAYSLETVPHPLDGFQGLSHLIQYQDCVCEHYDGLTADGGGAGSCRATFAVLNTDSSGTRPGGTRNFAAARCVSGAAVVRWRRKESPMLPLKFKVAAGAPGFALLCWMLALAAPATVLAHCDGMDGPVVQAARKALETGNVNHALIWVQSTDEAEVRKAFERATTARKLWPEARDIADLYFFETVVRVHRACEGAPYTGLKPAGRDLGPAIPAADRSIEGGSPQAVLVLIERAVHEGLKHRFHEVQARKGYRTDDLAAGREYVKAYVEWIHYVEGLYQAAAGPAPTHSHEEASRTSAHVH